ncbi:MAG: type II toxin-antitoxin system VapC family toxin [Candidatus Omnitrophica bacterium]|nr:type II toxin-antitoxin system VapC family toxin [Candidatus Omnitrophota bacterium]
MDKSRVYLETSVIGYATSKPSRDLVVAAHQQITRDWFAQSASDYELFVSQIVVHEILSGNPAAAEERREFLSSIPLLAVTEEVGILASTLIETHSLPKKASEDAMHIAVAAVHAVDFLLTWNCRHIANAHMRDAIEEVCREAGYKPPVICTPEELSHDEFD